MHGTDKIIKKKLRHEDLVDLSGTMSNLERKEAYLIPIFKKLTIWKALYLYVASHTKISSTELLDNRESSSDNLITSN